MLAKALLASQKLYYETNGYFDITIGSISKKLYRFGEENSTIPSQQALRDAELNIEGRCQNPSVVIVDPLAKEVQNRPKIHVFQTISRVS